MILKKGERCPPHHERVNLRYYVVPNVNANKGGWMPVYRNGNREHGDTYGRGLEKGQALSVAKAAAYEEGGKYAGDYCVIIGPGTRRKKHAR